MGLYEKQFFWGMRVNRSQRRKAVKVAASEIKEILANVCEEKDPASIPICTTCISFNSDTPADGCFIERHRGEIPGKGFCFALVPDPKRDPREGKVLAEMLRQDYPFEIQRRQGKVSEKGFYVALVSDPKRDPREGKVLAEMEMLRQACPLKE